MTLVLQLGDYLNEVHDIEAWKQHKTPTVFITDSENAREMLELAGIVYDGEIQLDKVGFSKVETSRNVLRVHFSYRSFQTFWVNVTR